MKKLFNKMFKTCHCERGFCVGYSDSETRRIEDKTNGNVSEMSVCPSGTIIQDESEAIQNNKMDCRVACTPRNNNNVNSQFTTHNSLVKAIAFTLAETLVVMGIIGVVAALTIPNLNQSTGDREKVAKLKKSLCKS